MDTTSNTKETEPDQKGIKRRTRSPNYPAVGLKEAIERIAKFYKADGRAGAPPEVAAMHLGFTTAHGQAMSTLAALKKFGLVAESNGRIAPTQRAVEILNLADNDPRRIQAIQEAATSPVIYRELFDAHRATGLPSNDALERELVTYRQFNPRVVAGFVTDFRDSLEFAGLSDCHTLEYPVKDTGDTEMMQAAVPSVPRPTAPAMPTEGGGQAHALAAASQQTYRWALSIPRNVAAELKITGADLRRKDIEMLEKQVALLKASFDDGGSGA